ncbi:hypothetical protein M011DRAFT_433810 [Sporormia fimetaria CBS 119925]|uniref:Pentacotripeptide-repeat region of PRORP domain-containing protein n=1 Tax=Sporormia fimetaria CBS 119925 TaxID=1340428 RepID=A0A6A6UX62_9PLEO|nr:hypothetical protein M011DRAFT_433810 [Sporormia fimetaria CBS 119925]
MSPFLPRSSMPRAFVADVVSVPAAEWSLLPFLAPRVCAEVVSRRRDWRYYGRITRTHGEKIGKDSRNKNKSSLASGQDQNFQKDCDGSPRSAHSLETTFPRRESYCPLKRNSRPATVSNDVWRRYADIGAFSRAQRAHYSTAVAPSRDSAASVGESSASRPTPASLVADAPATLASEEGKVHTRHTRRHREKVHIRRHEETADLRRSVPLHRSVHQSLVDHRRQKLLPLERSRFDHHVARYLQDDPNPRPGGLLLSGRYRSLRRRVFVLTRETTTVLRLENARPEGRILYAFAALDRKLYPKWRRKHHGIKLIHDSRSPDWATRLSKDASPIDKEKMFQNWQSFTLAEKRQSCHSLLLYLLDTEPLRALWLLHVLALSPEVKDLKPYVLADALEHIAGLAVRDSTRSVRTSHLRVFETPPDLVPVFCHVFSKHLARFPHICSQDLLYKLGQMCTYADLKKLLDLLLNNKAYLGYATLLHYANAFSKFGDHQNALRCLEEIARLVSSPAGKSELANRQGFRFSSALLLHKSNMGGKNYHLTTDIVAQITELGLHLDILLHNVIMNNAMKAGDYSTAFRVYNALEESGLQPDLYTYSILLHGCVECDNPHQFWDFASHCAEKARELKSPWLATEYLYFLYTVHKRDDPEQLSVVLNRAFTTFFSTKSIPDLLFPFSKETKAVEEDGNKMEPTVIALYLLFQVAIKALSTRGPSHILNLYNYFLRLIRSRKYPLFNELARGHTIWNTFLFEFCRRKQFTEASELIKTMTDDTTGVIPQPNVYTWNVFMSGFYRHKQPRAAERIFEIMQARGVKPDQYTNEVMLRGYAHEQHVDKIKDIMQFVDDERQLSPRIMWYLTMVRDQEKLMDGLEDAKREREKRMREERKLEVLEEKRRWEGVELD